MTRTYESLTNINTDRKSKVYMLTATAAMTAVICVLAPFSIPVGPVPVSLTTLALYFSVYLLGWKMSSLSCIIYILIGMAGLPVFSGFSGGPGKLAGAYRGLHHRISSYGDHYRNDDQSYADQISSIGVCFPS